MPLGTGEAVPGESPVRILRCSEAVFHRIEQLTSEALLEVANEMFAEDYLSTLIYR